MKKFGKSPSAKAFRIMFEFELKLSRNFDAKLVKFLKCLHKLVTLEVVFATIW